MPKVSQATAAKQQDIGIGTISSEVSAGYEFAFLSFTEQGVLEPLLKGLPNDLCNCPHWGYVVGGTVTFRHLDGSTESFSTGDAFYVEPGHTPVIEPGTDLLFISPEHQAAAVNAVIEANMAAMQGA
ncbi:hypothetical protein [Nocardioides marmorisolisilvae]|uniref:Cupin domain-containing protein n=1 Tax=Nocardioides marmorisolisilvae TaxID=1542737 RepID=A0A3N0DS37_9ACTN|nr:hypothetical protein [Nocardioides marmorisolisilvae]RNL78331.1 hypothetical protein EFL95_04285 [Nocardioides marmorisolisilvae]